jgi:hypothetical protein
MNPFNRLSFNSFILPRANNWPENEPMNRPVARKKRRRRRWEHDCEDTLPSTPK